MRKVYVDVTVKLILVVDDDADIQNVLDEMDYRFEGVSEKGEILDFHIEDYDIKDSK
jgi:CheY-like chemotaxis protein